jgi:hypothetical protein
MSEPASTMSQTVHLERHPVTPSSAFWLMKPWVWVWTNALEGRSLSGSAWTRRGAIRSSRRALHKDVKREQRRIKEKVQVDL